MKAAFRNAGPVQVPIALQAIPVAGELGTLAIDIPPFANNFSAQLVRGSLLCKVLGEGVATPKCTLFIESADGSNRFPLGSFNPEAKEITFGEEKHHPIDEYRLINFRTRGLMLSQTASTDNERGLRLIIQTENEADVARLQFFASGSALLPVLEISGVPYEQDLFIHHPAQASRIGLMTQAVIVNGNCSAFEALENALDGEKTAQAVIEDFIEGRMPEANRVLEVIPKLKAAAGAQEDLLRALGLLLHKAVIEPVGRAAAERLMHLAYHYERSGDARLAATTSAYTDLYLEVLEYERAFVGGRYVELPARSERVAQRVRSQHEALAEYSRVSSNLFSQRSDLW
jgi:hypothetical protein